MKTKFFMPRFAMHAAGYFIVEIRPGDWLYGSYDESGEEILAMGLEGDDAMRRLNEALDNKKAMLAQPARPRRRRAQFSRNSGSPRRRDRSR